MFRRIWAFVIKPRNAAALTLLGGAIAFLWKAAEPHLFPPPETKKEAVSPPETGQVAVATGAGAKAFNAAHNSQIGQDVERRDAIRAAPASTSAPTRQRAEASAGGQAVNAAGGSRVVIDSTIDAKP